jgi:CDGSH-type Zn-finger protein
MSEDNTTIDIMPDGPFIVNNLDVLENSKDGQIDCKKKVALCRCGASNNKPFCDGSHTKIGFTGVREANLKPSRDKEYAGIDISIFYNAVVCYHAKECVTNLPTVFDSDSRPWVNPNGSDAKSIINVIKKCPSGALSYKIGDIHTREFYNNKKIRIEKNGPYLIKGNIKLKLEDDLQPVAKDHYALCRCGASKNKPYCDGSHVKAGFKDDKN